MEYFFSIFVGTFVLEDVALASAIALAASGEISFVAAFVASFLGIAIGDLALYFVGFGVGKLGFEERFKSFKRIRSRFGSADKSNALTYSIVISRFIPGTRLPTYLAAGLLGYSFVPFVFLTAITVFAWVAFTFAAGRAISSILMQHWLLSTLLILFVFKILKTLIPKLSDPWLRKTILHEWRQWLSFEFWPAILFYLPIVPYYIYLSVRHRSLIAPFYANPEIENGGLIGESKWDFLKHLDAKSANTLKSLKIGKQDDFEKARELLDREGFFYPFILKPDVGQRGFGVRIIRDDFDLAEYLLLSDFDMIVQELSLLPCEAGVFYIRKPWETNGFIFSITDKKFPSVFGDGATKLGDLILKDKRARIISSVYFARHREHLSDIPQAGEEIFISECGNHCQGAIFLNGESMKTQELERAIHQIAVRIPNFYFGRFDIRYRNHESLKEGQNFEIVEINGAGSEATHIWDADTSIVAAYKTLFVQWSYLFEIGNYLRKKKIPSKIYLGKFLKESLHVFRRKNPLTVSS